MINVVKFLSSETTKTGRNLAVESRHHVIITIIYYDLNLIYDHYSHMVYLYLGIPVKYALLFSSNTLVRCMLTSATGYF